MLTHLKFHLFLVKKKEKKNLFWLTIPEFELHFFQTVFSKKNCSRLI